jgi:hypothetical protein
MNASQFLAAFLSAAMTVAVANEATAQSPAWAVGTWQGSLQNYPNDSAGPERVLAIGASGACVWDTPAKLGDAAKRLANPAAAKTCTYTNSSVELTTGPGSAVALQYKDGKLQGTFQTKTGRAPYFITMSKK